MKTNDWSRQQELKELKEYGGVHIEQTNKFFKDVDKIKDERCFADLEDE